MKKVLKCLGIILLAILGSIVGLFCFMVILALLKPEKNKENTSQIIIEYKQNPNSLPANQPELVYADTMEEALTYHIDYYFKGKSYMINVNDVIKVFENDEYATMFYHSINKDNEKNEGFIGSKFKIQFIDDKKQYALINVYSSEMSGKRGKNKLVFFQRTKPLYDFVAKYGINEENRFIFGTTHNEKIYSLKIEGQSPTEIIEYTVLGKPEYFWYYENIISDRPSAEFEIEIEE